MGLTQFGGVTLIEHFLRRIGLRGALSDHLRFAQRNNRYSLSESLVPITPSVRFEIPLIAEAA